MEFWSPYLIPERYDRIFLMQGMLSTEQGKEGLNSSPASAAKNQSLGTPFRQNRTMLLSRHGISMFFICCGQYNIEFISRRHHMKVGVIGSGTVGQTLAGGFLKHGRQVMLGTRNPKDAKILSWQSATPGAIVGDFEQTSKFGELIVLAVLARAVEEVIRLAGPENFNGKTLIDLPY